MTREQKIEAFTMRIDGASVQKIAEQLGVSTSMINYTFASAKNARIKDRVFPNIERWMEENKVTQKALAEKLGISHTALTSYLTGRHAPSFYFVESMVKETGMPFEEAFSKERTNV